MTLPSNTFFKLCVYVVGLGIDEAPPAGELYLWENSQIRSSLVELWRNIISDTVTLHLQPHLLNLAQKWTTFYNNLVKRSSQIEMDFKCLEASTGELQLSENSAASSKHTSWVRLTPYLTLKNHVSKHT